MDQRQRPGMTQKIVQYTVHNASPCKVYVKYTTGIQNLKSRNTKRKENVTNGSPEEISARGGYAALKP